MKSVNWMLPQTPVTPVEVERFETVSKVNLPEDFKSWLLRHNGSCPEPPRIDLDDGQGIYLNSFLSFSRQDKYNVFSMIETMSGRLPEGLVPIADDSGGNFVCFRYSSRTSQPEVVFWDHEEADPKLATRLIAASFSEFVSKLRGED
ncbi:MAG TPA: SMI1/KNR4 family protein [Candidatus Hydrogenedentes bacterium]|mgnify:CR=1 FL=1|nr:SMI1/KNR4 family protein [Candidatus Hydrogenedentota bacterium]HPG68284.1 SMI1/KNR4 family protein [Candidatus Hydrogenedentota bacterium]